MRIIHRKLPASSKAVRYAKQQKRLEKKRSVNAERASAQTTAQASRQIDTLLRFFEKPITLSTKGPAKNELHNWELAGPAMVWSAASCLLSVQNLSRFSLTRRTQDVSVLLRRLYDHAVTFAWIAASPEKRARQWVADDYCHRLKADKDLRALGIDALSEDKQKQYRDFAEENKGFPNLLEMAEEADLYWASRILGNNIIVPGTSLFGVEIPIKVTPWSLRSLYGIVYKMTSAYAHSTPLSIEGHIRHLLRSDSALLLDASDQDETRAYRLAPVVFSMQAIVAAHSLGLFGVESIVSAMLSAGLAEPEGYGPSEST